MNKEDILNKVKNKRQKRIKKAQKKYPEQINLIRFIEFLDKDTEKVNGNLQHPKFYERKGLQIENRFYFICRVDDVTFSLINKKGTKILKVYDDIPEWAHPKLIEKYNKKKEQINEV